MRIGRCIRIAVPGIAVLAFAAAAAAQNANGPGVTETEIRIGQTMPYSGPLSVYGTIGRAEAAYLEMINAKGGIGGRRIRLISLDDGFSPPKTVEQTRRLVEADDVLLIFSSLGTPTNSAVYKYLNAKKVPQLFVVSGAAKFDDPKHYPWTMRWHPGIQTEGAIYARHVLQANPAARIAVLYQNDDFGREYLKGLEDGLGEKAAAQIVARATYEPTDPTIGSQIITLQASGADTLLDFSTAKAASQSIAKAAEIGWRPLHIVSQVATSVSGVLAVAGLDKARGLISSAYYKDPADPRWSGDAALKEWNAWMQQYYPEGDRNDGQNVLGYTVAQALVHVLRQCGSDLSRENVMRQAANLKGVELPMLLPGIRMNTGADDFAPFQHLWLQRFDGRQWVLFGGVMER
jgi:branched-chain amino acid transport system substrate-binding protein